jgi:hypothetical protein
MGIRVLGKIMQSQRFGIPDQQAKDAMACGERTDPAGEVILDSYRDEMTEALVTADDSQRSVIGFQEVAGRTDHPEQDGLQAQVLGKRNHGIQQPPHPLLGAHEFAGTVYKVGEKFVHAGGDNRFRNVRGLADGFTHRNRLPRYLTRT